MGNGGKYEERARARLLRAEAWTLAEIAAELDVAKSSVSRWVRDVPFEPRPRHRGTADQAPHPAAVARAAHEEACNAAGLARFSSLSDDAFFAAGVALYVGQGSKTNGTVSLANTDPAVIGIPRSQFVKPYRSRPSGGRKRTKHEFGCFTVRYASTSLAREVLGLCSGLLYSSVPDPG